MVTFSNTFFSVFKEHEMIVLTQSMYYFLWWKHLVILGIEHGCYS